MDALYFNPGLPKTPDSTSTTCPICLERPIEICYCEFRDSKCPNGHKWHYKTVEGKKLKIQGHGH